LPLNFSHATEARSLLKLSKSELLRLINELESKDSAQHEDKRRSPRTTLPDDITVTAGMVQPDGSENRFLVKGRNVSDHGLSFLHGAFVHTDTRCNVTFTKADGECVQLETVVKHCRYLTDGVHEVGAMFKHAFPMRDFIESDDTVATASLSRLNFDAKVVLVDDCPSSLRMHKYMLSQLGLSVAAFADAHAALEAIADQPYDLLLTDIWMQSMDGIELARRVHADGHETRIVATTGDDRPEMQEKLKAADFAGVMSKPLSQEKLVTMLREVVPLCEKAVPTQAETLVSDRWHELDLRPLISAYVHETNLALDVLKAAVHASRRDLTVDPYSISRDLAVNAATYGYQPMKTTADKLARCIGRDAGAQEIDQLLDTLQDQLEQAKRGLTR